MIDSIGTGIDRIFRNFRSIAIRVQERELCADWLEMSVETRCCCCSKSLNVMDFTEFA